MKKIFLSCTRFSNKTWNENVRYRKSNNIPVLYGTDMRIRIKYPMLTEWVVIEMNNDLNKIMGIGFIENKIVFEPTHHIYSIPNFNRYIYKGDKWISRELLVEKNPELVKVLEKMLFTGKSHLKRLTGISRISDDLLNKYDIKGGEYLIELFKSIKI